MSMNLNEKSILITGGTGSLGKQLTKTLLSKWPNIKRIVIFSRDEQKQYQMSNEVPFSNKKCMRFFIGDVRDYERLKRALTSVDYVIHAAAMKHVHIAEYNPDECIKTNIGGAENVIRASIEMGIKKVVALSTDKACSPINLYGATKLTSDKLFIAANNIKGHSDISFSVVRYGNVLGSNGSVVPFFLKEKNNGILPITNTEMTRFNISLEEGVDMVLHALDVAWGGEIFVPKIPSYKILDLAKAIGPDCKIVTTGIRPGEKIHEEMISLSDSFTTYDVGKYYVILPSAPSWDLSKFIVEFSAKKLDKHFSYNSLDNTEWETVESLKQKILSFENKQPI